LIFALHANRAENGSVFIFGDKGIDKLVGAIGINHYFFSSATTCMTDIFFKYTQLLKGMSNTTKPSLISELPYAEEVACGGYHTCVLTSNHLVLNLHMC